MTLANRAVAGCPVSTYSTRPQQADIRAVFPIQRFHFVVATVIALAGTFAPEAGAQKICPDGTLAGANQPCGLHTATARKGGKATRSVGGLKAETEVIEKPRKKPGKAAPRN